MSTIAVLYIDPRGPYPKLPGVDCYGLPDRDARAYAGPHPVVAHPPCGPWGRLRHLYKGAEHDCAPRAVEQVRRWGGVVEHPAGSKLWDVCGLPEPAWFANDDAYFGTLSPEQWRPLVRGWSLTGACGGYTIELDQCEWGHVARKRTRLYLVGVPRSALEAPPFPGREPTHWISGFRSTTRPRKYDRSGIAVPPGIKVCSAQQRRRTPPLFAEYLIRLARAVRS